MEKNKTFKNSDCEKDTSDYDEETWKLTAKEVFSNCCLKNGN